MADASMRALTDARRGASASASTALPAPRKAALNQGCSERRSTWDCEGRDDCRSTRLRGREA